jgi:alpha-N-arabinofuranosidase
MINVLQAMILTDGPKMILTPTYHVYHMYVPFQEATLIPVSFDAGNYRYGDISLPRVDAVAARDKAGQLWLSVVNIDPDEAAEVTLDVPGLAIRSAKGQVLTAPRVDSINTFEQPQAVAPRAISATSRGGKLTLKLPPKAIAVVALQP